MSHTLNLFASKKISNRGQVCCLGHNDPEIAHDLVKTGAHRNRIALGQGFNLDPQEMFSIGRVSDMPIPLALRAVGITFQPRFDS